MLTLTAEDGFKLSAYRANPGGAPRGVLAIVQEIFGVNSHMLDKLSQSRRLGEAAHRLRGWRWRYVNSHLGRRDVNPSRGPDYLGRERKIRRTIKHLSILCVGGR